MVLRAICLNTKRHPPNSTSNNPVCGNYCPPLVCLCCWLLLFLANIIWCLNAVCTNSRSLTTNVFF